MCTRRADARIGQGCWQVEAVNAIAVLIALPRGTSTIHRVRVARKKTPARCQVHQTSNKCCLPAIGEEKRENRERELPRSNAKSLLERFEYYPHVVWFLSGSFAFMGLLEAVVVSWHLFVKHRQQQHS